MNINKLLGRPERYFKPGFFGALVTHSGSWLVDLAEKDFIFLKPGKPPVSFSYETIHHISCKPGVIWSEISVKSSDGSVEFDGIGNEESHGLVDALKVKVSDALLASIDPHRKAITNLSRSFITLMGKEQYLANFDIVTWTATQETKIGEPARAILAAVKNPLFPASRLEGSLKAQTETLMGILQGRSTVVAERNRRFVDAEMGACKAFFDSVEKTPLTDEQRRAAIVMEDRNLLIAAAGSGKTSSVVGKVGYAILRGYAAPNQILVLAFNNHAAKELEERINERLGGILNGSSVKVKTFHALGLEIIADVENAKPTVPDYAGDSGGGRKLVDELIQQLISTDRNFATDWTLFRAAFFRAAENPAKFTSEEDWHKYVKETGDYIGKRNGYQTLNGELVKSQGELAIANWLYMNGVAYLYEKPYQYRTADKQYRQYHPDFFFPDIGCYLEHYALDANGHPPPAFGDKYLQSREWKRALHAEKGTDVFETYFSEFVSGALFGKLESELTARCIKLKPRSTEEILDRINQHQGSQNNEFYSFLLTFMKHAKSNQISVNELESAARSHSQAARATLFVRLISKIMDQYAQELRNSECVDFEDMIINAARYSKEGRYQHSYQMILVDEFQDISRARADLLQGLLKHAPTCKMFAVGDDWQSIYRFAGSDISLFTSFEGNFGVTATNHLTRTFRSNQGIANVAARFVQNNRAQIQKSVVAVDPLTEQVIAVRRVERRQDVENHICACLNDIADVSREAKDVRSVFFLGRYRRQQPENLAELRKRFAGVLTLDFKTIHSSKGLQADYVILLGLQSGKFGFPSVIADDPLLALVMPSPEMHPHAEERRLFYVALTRARHGVFLLASKFLPSVFMDELEANSEYSAMLRYPETEGISERGDPIEKCPECGRGRLKVRTGKYGQFLGCSEYPSCRFTRDLAGR